MTDNGDVNDKMMEQTADDVTASSSGVSAGGDKLEKSDASSSSQPDLTSKTSPASTPSTVAVEDAGSTASPVRSPYSSIAGWTMSGSHIFSPMKTCVSLASAYLCDLTNAICFVSYLSTNNF